jgi:hypothetical protein
MGTPCAPPFANIVMYYIDHPILENLPHCFYRRYLDDIFSALSRTNAMLFITLFNQTNAHIQLEQVTLDSTGIFLDLQLTLRPISDTHCTLVHTLYQKPINIYQYIPPMSQHAPHIFYNLVLQELKRYRLACTDSSDFMNLVSVFQTRLVNRAYPLHLVHKALTSLPSRDTLLAEISPPSIPQVVKLTPPIITLRLPRLSPPPKWRSLFSIPSTIRTLSEYQAVYQTLDVLIGTRNSPSIANYVTRSTFTS